MHVCMYVCVDGWMDEFMYGWMDLYEMMLQNHRRGYRYVLHNGRTFSKWDTLNNTTFVIIAF